MVESKFRFYLRGQIVRVEDFRIDVARDPGIKAWFDELNTIAIRHMVNSKPQYKESRVLGKFRGTYFDELEYVVEG